MPNRQKIKLSQKEFNNKLDELDDLNIDYEIEPTAYSIKAIVGRYTFQASLFDDINVDLDPKQISREFGKKTGYHYLDKEENPGYGYKMQFRGSKSRIFWAFTTASGYFYTDDRKASKWLKCWSYDVNSAFSYAMLQPMPDTHAKPIYNDVVQKGEIGFNKDGSVSIEEGAVCDIIFPLMESPFKPFVYEYYNKKCMETNELKRLIWKLYLNIPTGCVQRHNIFLRNAIIYYSNQYIKQFIDENTVYCNVDCIISTVPRTDLPLGNEIGQFKNEHIKDNFKYRQAGIYQWNDECHYKGIKGYCITDIDKPDGWFEELKKHYKFIYNEEKRRLELNG